MMSMSDDVPRDLPSPESIETVDVPPNPAPPPPPVEPPPAEPQRVDRIVDDWVRDHIPGSPIALAVDAWNHLHAALPELKRRLKEGT